MLAIALLLATSQLNDLRPERTRGDFRVSRSGNGLPFFSAFEISGAGVGAECACANPTGTKGETSATTRANTLDCRKGGPWRISGIAVGDVVSCASNLPRIEQDGAGVLGIEAWGSFTIGNNRSDQLDDAYWTSTEAVTANAATAPINTLTAEQLNDTSGAVQSCTSRTIASTSATHHVVSAYVRAGTIAQAQVKIVGTGSSTGDCTATSTTLDGTMWDRLWCKSPAAYAGTLTAVTISVCVGDAVGDTGTIMAWRVNWSENFPSTLLYPPPSGETVAASLSSNYERVTFTLPFAMSPTAGSHAASVTPAWSSGLASPVVGPQVLWYDWAARPMYGPASANYMWSFDGTTGPSNAVAWTGGSSVRIWSSYTGSTMQLNDGTDTASGAFDGTFGDAALTALSVGGSSSAVSSVYGVITKVCADPNPLRCR